MQAAGTVSDSAAIRDALETIAVEGIIGPIEFDENNQAHPPVYITQWCEDGSRSILYPEETRRGVRAPADSARGRRPVAPDGARDRRRPDRPTHRRQSPRPGSGNGPGP